MTSQAGRTVSGQSAGSGQWPEAAGSPPRQGTAGGTAPQSDAHRLRWRCGSWGRCGFREKRNGCARPGRRAPQLRPAPPSPRGPPATSAPRREATALGLRPPRRSLRSPVSLRPEPQGAALPGWRRTLYGERHARFSGTAGIALGSREAALLTPNGSRVSPARLWGTTGV